MKINHKLLQILDEKEIVAINKVLKSKLMTQGKM